MDDVLVPLVSLIVQVHLKTERNLSLICFSVMVRNLKILGTAKLNALFTFQKTANLHLIVF